MKKKTVKRKVKKITQRSKDLKNIDLFLQGAVGSVMRYENVSELVAMNFIIRSLSHNMAQILTHG